MVQPRTKKYFQPRIELLEDRTTPSAGGFNNLNLGVISGSVYLDANGNNVRDAGEAAVPGVVITLTGTSNTNAPVSLTATTDTSGNYQFFQLQPGTYTLTRGSVSSSFSPAKFSAGSLGGTLDTTHTAITNIAVNQGQDLINYNFAVGSLKSTAVWTGVFLASTTASTVVTFAPAGTGQAFADGSVQPSALAVFPSMAPASLSGSVLDQAQHGIAGATVTLNGIDITGKVFTQSTTTSSTGVFQFTSLRPGTYTVEVTPLKGYQVAAPAVGTDGGVALHNDQIAVIQVAAGDHTTGYTFKETKIAAAVADSHGIALKAVLYDQTGSTTQTTDPTVEGTLTSTLGLTSFMADFGGTPVSILSQVSGGNFFLNPALLNVINVTTAPITAASWASNVATITAANSFSAGQSVTISGMTPTGYNGTFTITSATSTSFTYALTTNPGVGTAFGTAASSTPLANGSHTLRLVATDSKGHTNTVTVTFDLETTAPTTPTLAITTGGTGTTATGTTVTLAGTTTASENVALTLSTTFTGNTTLNSLTVGNLSSTTGLQVGMAVTGNGIPANATIASIFNATTITLSQKATATATGVSLTFSTTPLTTSSDGTGNFNFSGVTLVPATDGTVKAVVRVTDNAGNISQFATTLTVNTAPPKQATSTVTLTGNTTLNSTTISGLSSTAGLLVGMNVTGTGIPANATIASIVSTTSITISQKATAAGTGVSLTFNLTGTTKSASTAVTNLASTTGLVEGMSVTGTGIATGTTIASIVNGTSITLSKNATASGAVPLTFSSLPNITVDLNTTTQAINLAGTFQDANFSDSVVTFNTLLGPVNVRFDDTMTPVTVANIFNYINSGEFANDIFHRSVTSPFVLQGGGFSYSGGAFTAVTAAPSIQNEFSASRSNLAGTIAMAKGSAADSATSQFFFNMGDNSASLDSLSNSGGFTVFGNVADGFSQRVLNTYAAFPTSSQTTTNSAFTNLPLKGFTGTTFPTGVTPSNLAFIQSVTVDQRSEALTYTATSSDSTVVTATIANTTTNPNNILTLGYLKAGTATITVTATDQAGNTQQATFTVTVNPSLVVSPTTLPTAVVGKAYSQTISTTGGSGSPTLTTTNTSGSIAGLAVPTTGSAGTLVVSGTPTAAGTVTFSLSATDAGGTVTQSYTVAAILADPAQSVVSVASSNVASSGTTTVTLTAKDVHGVPLTKGGLTVVFSLGSGAATGTFGTVTDLGNGTYTATFTAGTVAGSNTITATINGLAVTSTANIKVAPGPVSVALSTIAVSPTSVESGGTTTVTLTAKDANGNQETTGGATVLFSLGAGTATGTFGAVTDNGNGSYTATFTGGTPGSSAVSATINGNAVTSAAPSVIVVGTASPAQSTISVSPASIQAGGVGTTVTLTAKDANGNLKTVGGSTVTFGLTNGSSGGSFSAVTDNGNGTYTATFTSTATGSNSITATLDSNPVTTASPIVTVTPGPLDLTQSTVSLVSSSISLGNSTNVTLTAKDADGNQLINGGAIVLFSLGSGTATGSFSAVTDNGDGTYTATFTSTGSGTNTITATVNGNAVTSTAPTITVN